MSTYFCSHSADKFSNELLILGLDFEPAWEDILRNAEAADSAASEAVAFVASAKRQSVAVGVGEELHHSVEEGLHSALL